MAEPGSTATGTAASRPCGPRALRMSATWIPNVGLIQGLEALADMIGSSIQAPMEGHEAEAREEHARGMSGSGVSVEVVTPIESFHHFYRYSYIWHFPDGSSSGGTCSFCEQAADGRIRLITAWPASDRFAIPPSARA